MATIKKNLKTVGSLVSKNVKSGVRTGLNKAKDLTINAVKETAKNTVYNMGLKGRQNKMIKAYVDRQPSKLATENRSIGNVIREKENMDKSIKDKLRKKGIYK